MRSLLESGDIDQQWFSCQVKLFYGNNIWSAQFHVGEFKWILLSMIIHLAKFKKRCEVSLKWVEILIHFSQDNIK